MSTQLALNATADAVQRGAKFVPVIYLDGEAHYFTSPLPGADHVAFADAPMALAAAANFLGELRKILAHSLQEFIH